MERVVDKFLRYVRFDTRSSEESDRIPTTEKQLKLAEQLSEELNDIGLTDVSLDKNGYVMASIEGNIDGKVPCLGFISHMDTSPEISGSNVNPKIIENYDGKDIVLNEKDNIVLKTEDFPEIERYKGKTLITTDGNTLLGADDKAGIAEIMAAAEYIIRHPEIQHGDIKIAFTPDEEVGQGADHFDIKKFNAQFAYTVDGGEIGELEFENFNAASAEIKIGGRNVHPGSAKGKMINSMLVASEFMDMLPADETPETTEGYQGFYHIVSIKGGVEQTRLSYIIRDFDRDNFEKRKKFIQNCGEIICKKYGRNIVKINVEDQYSNMREKIEPVKYIVDIAAEAMNMADVEPKISAIRGGTDGARLSFEGLPTPNIFTGGHNFHGRYEYIPVFAMEKAIEVIVNIIKLTAKL